MQKTIFAVFGLMFLAACAGGLETGEPADSQPEKEAFIKLEDLGPAPELNNETWLNTDQPLRLADLRGKVVLLDMWTFG